MIDMNYTYPKTRIIFQNVIVVVDKFHIVNVLNRVFIKTRVRIMKKSVPFSRKFKALNH
ncbi:transposase [Pediococcus acidilactici]|uniref:transposase n=1 Tax=Pediococcus acidilactici TaxID=1254 RepID=UPI001F3AE5B3|nr:transposase [Pediococcus acidilactici]